MVTIETELSTADGLEALFRDQASGLVRALYAYTGGRRDVAEEAAAEAFARAIAYRDSIRDPAAWIYRTAFRIAARELKHEGRQTVLRDEAAQESSPGLRDLVSALRQLSPNQRAAIVLHYEADLSVAEISRRTGMAKATVRVHLHRGRKALRQLLGAEEVNDA